MTLTKTCTKCGVEKSLDDFFGNTRNKTDGKQSQCKKCKREWVTKNKDHLKVYKKQYRIDNHDKEILNSRSWKANHKEERILYGKTYYHEHKEEILIQCKQYQETHRDTRQLWRREYYINNKEYFVLKRKLWAQSNNGKISKHKSNAKRKRDLGFIPLNNILPDHDGHHIDRDYIIYIPEKLHRSCPHGQNGPESMQKINKLAWEYLNDNKMGINYKNLAQYNAENDQ